MPLPTDKPFPTNADNREDFAHFNRTAPVGPGDVTNVDVAEMNASKELGRLAVFILQNFPEQTGEGKAPVDIIISLLSDRKEPIETLGQIDLSTQEGKLLIAAMAVLTSSPSITLNRKEFDGRRLTPGEVLGELVILSDYIQESE